MSENGFVSYNSEEDEKNQPEKDLPKNENKKRSSLSMILNGDFLTFDFIIGNLAYIFFVFFLLILALAKNYYSKGIEDDIIKTQRSIDEISREYIEVKTRVEVNVTRDSLSSKLERIGLKETKNQTKVIRLK